MAIGLKFINGDFTIDANGAVPTIDRSEKCLRDFGKMMQTDIQTPQNETNYTRYNPTYGNLLTHTELYSGLTRARTLEVLNDLVYNTIQNYLSLQEERSNLDLGEIIASIKYDIYWDPDNSALVNIPIKITTGEGLELSTIEYEQSVV